MTAKEKKKMEDMEKYLKEELETCEREIYVLNRAGGGTLYQTLRKGFIQEIASKLDITL